MKKQTAAGGIIISNDNARVWLVLPSNNFGPWCFPKGRLDQGETIEQAAIREVKEEAGLPCRIEKHVGVYEGYETMTHYYIMRKIGPKGKHDFETQEVKEYALDDALELLLNVGNTRDYNALLDAISLIDA